MVQTDSVKDMLLHLYQKNTSRENLKLTQVTKNSFQLYGFLLNLKSRPKEIESNGNLSKHKLLKDFSPVDSLLAEIYSMRCCRKYGRAQKLEEVASKWINKLTECQPNERNENKSQPGFITRLKMVKHSKVWKYFSQTTETSVHCGLCNQRLAFTHKTTTSMKYHMERKHPLQWALGSNVREIDSDPLTGDSISTVVISEEADPEYDPEQLQSPKAKSRRLNSQKSQKNQSETALVPYDVDRQLSQVGGSSNRMYNNTTQLDGAKIAAITYFITEMLVRDLLPLKQVENQGFKQLIDYMEPTYSIPSREGITQSLTRLYNEVKPIVVQSISQTDTLALTMDIWTSATSRLYVTLSAHWVNKDWSLTKRVLSTSSLEAGYAVEDLGSRVLQTLNDYSINLEKVTAIVHSDSENRPFEIGGIPAVTCFAFTLQEAVKKALELPPVHRLVTAARKLVGSVAHLSGSIVEWPSQNGEKTQLNVSEIKLESDVPSRWFTTCTMLKLLHEQRTILGVLVGDDAMDRTSEGVLGPNSEEWDVLGEIVSVLRPLKTATDVISGEKNVSVSGVFPILHGLTTVHLMEDLEDSATAQLFKEVIRSEIHSRWCLDSLDVVETVPVIASLLDPRYRDPLYLSVEQRANVKVGHDFEKCLKFLLHLSNWENADKTILGSPWTIPVISQTILREDESGIPSTHGDSNIYKTSFCYSHYPDKIFEEVETISESEDDFPGIFEATPGRDRNGNTLFKIPDNRSNSINYKGFFLFGAVRSPTTLMREDSTDISLSLPILTNRQPNPMMYSLSAINSTDKQKKSELTPSPEDEGFVDVESGVATPEQYDPTSIWEEVCKAKDLLPPRTWETRIGPPRPLNQRTMLTSAGPEATNNVYLNYLHDLQLMAGLSSGSLLPAGPLLTLGQLFLDVVHLLFGVASDTFLFEADTRKFYIKSSSYVTGSTPETVGRMMEDFLDCGAIYVNLEEFSSGMETDYLSHAGFVLQRFKEGVSDYLQYYRGFILHAAETHGESLLLFHRKILGIYRQLRYLNDLCAGEKNVQARIGLRMGLPKGLQLLTYLYDQAIKDWGGDNTYLLLFLLRCACAPYLVFLQNWLFDAKFYDPHSEYDVEIQENFLSEDFGELFWQEGFKLKAKLRSVPFLGPIISKAILVCGKSLNLLKMCHPKHDLLDGRHQLRPVLSISLTQNELKTTQDCSEAYFKSLNAKMEKPKNNVVVKKIELKTCVDVTIPKIGDNNVLISTVPTRTRSLDPKEVRVIVEEEENAKPNPPVKPKINYPPKLKDMEEEMMSERDQEFQRIESELIKELTDEYQEMVEAEDRKMELINWQSKRLGLETESSIEFVSKNVSETVESYSSSTVTGTEKHSIQTETTTKICKELSNLSTDQNEYDDVEDDFEIDSDSESLPTVRERVTLITPQLDSNIQEEDDIELPQDDEMFDDDGDFKDDETIVEEKSEDTVKDDDNDDDARSETRCDEIDDDDEDDTNDDDGIENNEINKQDMESSLYKSMYLIHEPAPYEDQYNTFGSCPSRDLFSIAKSASQIFAPSDDLNDQDDMTSDVIPLPILIQRSLHPPLLAQIRLVNRATLNFFNEELKINDHFEALRNFFFFQDGEFGHSLSQLIFDKLRDGSHQLYNSLSNPFELMSILETALCSSLPSSKESNLGDNLYLINARSNSQRQESDHVDVTKYISLKYKVTWPLNIIITESCLQSYDKIFSLLLRVKQVIWALTNCWYHLKNKDNKYGKLSGVLEYRRIQLFRHEMLHFIRSVHTHICCQLLQLSWAEFREKIKNKVQDLDDLKTAHESYLNFALRRCLLAKDQEIVLKILERSFALIQQFHLQVISLSWECGRCCDDKGFERIMKTRSDFLSYSLKLYKVLKASLKKHRQPYVVDFLVLLDFNGFYDQSLVASLRNAKN